MSPAQFDELSARMGSVGQSGNQPVGKRVEDSLDDLWRKSSTLSEVVSRLIEHNRAGPNWSQNVDQRQQWYFEFRYSDVGSFVWDSTLTIPNCAVFYHGSGARLTHCVQVLRAFDQAATWNASFRNTWRVAIADDNRTGIQVDPGYVTDKAITGLLFYRADLPVRFGASEKDVFTQPGGLNPAEDQPLYGNYEVR